MKIVTVVLLLVCTLPGCAFHWRNDVDAAFFKELETIEFSAIDVARPHTAQGLFDQILEQANKQLPPGDQISFVYSFPLIELEQPEGPIPSLYQNLWGPMGSGLVFVADYHDLVATFDGRKRQVIFRLPEGTKKEDWIMAQREA